jgi:hypothetical protein
VARPRLATDRNTVGAKAGSDAGDGNHWNKFSEQTISSLQWMFSVLCLGAIPVWLDFPMHPPWEHEQKTQPITDGPSLAILHQLQALARMKIAHSCALSNEKLSDFAMGCCPTILTVVHLPYLSRFKRNSARPSRARARPRKGFRAENALAVRAAAILRDFSKPTMEG